jgi:F0F1-type ATP synthase membrane subunit b/b'
MIGWLLLVLGFAVVAFLLAVWFGQRMIAPRIARALDRADAEDSETRDRDH